MANYKGMVGVLENDDTTFYYYDLNGEYLIRVSENCSELSFDYGTNYAYDLFGDDLLTDGYEIVYLDETILKAIIDGDYIIADDENDELKVTKKLLKYITTKGGKN